MKDDINISKEEKYAQKAEAFAQNAQSDMPKMSKLSIIWNCLYLALYLVFIGYNLLSGKGNRIINFIILGFTAAYGVFYFITVGIANGNRKLTKKKIKPAKRVYKLVKRVFKLVNVMMMITLLVQTKGYYENNKFAVIMAFITTPMVIIQLSIDISRVILTYQIKRLKRYYDHKLSSIYDEFKNGSREEKQSLIKRIASELKVDYVDDGSKKEGKLKRLLSLFGEKQNNAFEQENNTLQVDPTDADNAEIIDNQEE